MQLIDAPKELDQSVELYCDVCIVGAGVAGIFLGRALADAGFKVCIIEAGGRACLDEQEIGFQANQVGNPYKGATVGRAFGLGGTGTQWGGVLAPYTKSDLRETETGQFDVWQHIVGTVRNHTADVLASIGFKKAHRSGQYFEKVELGETQRQVRKEGLDLVSAEVLPFRTRNFLSLLQGADKSSGELLVYLRTVITSLEVYKTGESPSVTKVACGQAGSHTIRVRANSFVLCAGAIETTRILLEMHRANSTGERESSRSLGKCLGDHISSAIAEIPPEDWVKTARRFGPVFLAGKMRSFRMVGRGSPATVPRYFTHFIFEQENPGFILAKKILAGVQSRSKPDLSLSDIGNGLSGLSLLALNRYFNSKLYIPKTTPVHLQLDIEQLPCTQNRVTIGSELDAFDRPKAVIDWEIRDDDYAVMEVTAQHVFSQWPTRNAELPRLKALDHGVIGNVHDAYHPVGTCRMGTDLDAVVGPDLRVHGNANLYVLSTAVFPTAGTANPTFSMLCFGSALASTLKERTN